MKLDTYKGILDTVDQVIDTVQKDKELYKKLSGIGFMKESLQQGIALRAKAVESQDSKEKYYDDRWAISKQLNQDLEAAIKTFKLHVKIARIAFMREPYRIRTMKIQKFAKGRWELVRQADRFYSHLIHSSYDLSAYGMGKPVLEQAKAAIDAVSTAKFERMRRKGMAEHSTQEKQKAFTDLKQWLKEFRQLARFALRDQPQLLEGFGIVVPSSTK